MTALSMAFGSFVVVSKRDVLILLGSVLLAWQPKPNDRTATPDTGPTSHRVHNIEVMADPMYLVSDYGVLSHNASSGSTAQEQLMSRVAVTAIMKLEKGTESDIYLA